MTRTRMLVAGFGVAIAGAAAAQQPAPPVANAARIAELEAQIAQLTQQLDALRAQRGPDIRWAAAPLGVHAPASPLQRLSAVDAGCPPGAVCLVVRCDASHGR